MFLDNDGYKDDVLDDAPNLLIATWGMAYLSEVRRALEEQLSDEVVRNPTHIAKAVTAAEECPTCAPNAYEILHSFVPILAGRIGWAVDTVRLTPWARNPFLPLSAEIETLGCPRILKHLSKTIVSCAYHLFTKFCPVAT